VVRALSEDDRARAIALLEAAHEFPLLYPLSVITRNVESVVAEMHAAAAHGQTTAVPGEDYQTVLSSGGRFRSHRFTVPCRSAVDVLALFDRLRQVEGVVQVL
jgi:putative lipoic acid-binding regulatory protein